MLQGSPRLFVDLDAMFLQLLFGTLLGLLASVGVVQSGLVTAEDAIGVLAGLVDRAIVTNRAVDVAILDVLNDLTGVLLRLLRGVGVGDVGLVAADNIAQVLAGRHVAEEYAEGRFECDGLWKRLLRRNRGGLLGLYTPTGDRGNDLMSRTL